MFQRWFQSWRQTTIANRFVAIASVIVAFSTVIYVFVAYFQWQALLDSNRTNREALESVQRAFVTFSAGVTVVGVIDTKTTKIKEWDFRVPMGNSGVTPAREVQMCISPYVSPGKIPENFTYPDTCESSFRPPFPLAPKEQSGSVPVGKLKPSVMLDIKNGKQHLYIYGWATYRDIFKESRLHVTKFCYEMIEFDPDPFTAKGLTNTFFVYSGPHNCTDEDCEKQP